jgi:hypothetical protein
MADAGALRQARLEATQRFRLRRALEHLAKGEGKAT